MDTGPSPTPSLGAAAQPGTVTGLLRAWRGGDVEARAQLISVLYTELRRQAATYLRRERIDHTLQPTALVHEAYLRLIGQERAVWQNRGHFLGVAAQMMRRILVDHARAHHRGKRFGAALRVPLDDSAVLVASPACDLVTLDEALDELSAIDPRQSRIVELRFFGGLSESEVSAVLAISRSTVSREWQIAKGWLYRRLMDSPPSRARRRG